MGKATSVSGRKYLQSNQPPLICSVLNPSILKRLLLKRTKYREPRNLPALFAESISRILALDPSIRQGIEFLRDRVLFARLKFGPRSIQGCR